MDSLSFCLINGLLHLLVTVPQSRYQKLRGDQSNITYGILYWDASIVLFTK